jgi:hypothetical protein
MYQIMLGTIRADLARTLKYAKMDEDAAVAFAIAADQEALVERLLICSNARLSLARLARASVGALNECARALYLMECAGRAKRFSEFMLGCASTFERAAYLAGLSLDETEGEYMAVIDDAKLAWDHLMREGIFGEEMYAYEGADSVIDKFTGDAS